MAVKIHSVTVYGRCVRIGHRTYEHDALKPFDQKPVIVSEEQAAFVRVFQRDYSPICVAPLKKEG